MRSMKKFVIWLVEIIVGCAAFALGFDLFLEPNNINLGGLSGLAMIFVVMTRQGSIGWVTLFINVPLFLLGAKIIDRKFFFGSLVGAAALSVFMELFELLPPVQTEPLLGAIYGGLLCGGGGGLVFLAGASTGGSDIVARLLKKLMPNLSLGKLLMGFDGIVVVLTGIMFRNVSTMLYCGITLYVSSIVLDAVVYSFDYSKVALVVSPKHEEIATAICDKLDRGVTYLKGEGYYSGKDTKVILTAIKRQQLAELKELVTDIDPHAFVILQESHQVLGEGFAHYTGNDL